MVPTYPFDLDEVIRKNRGMFLRSKIRRKDGKIHRYWSIVENRRIQGNRHVQRQVLYLGEINDTQQAAWCKTIEIFQEGKVQPEQMVLLCARQGALTWG